MTHKKFQPNRGQKRVGIKAMRKISQRQTDVQNKPQVKQNSNTGVKPEGH